MEEKCVIFTRENKVDELINISIKYLPFYNQTGGVGKMGTSTEQEKNHVAAVVMTSKGLCSGINSSVQIDNELVCLYRNILKLLMENKWTNAALIVQKGMPLSEKKSLEENRSLLYGLYQGVQEMLSNNEAPLDVYDFINDCFAQYKASIS